MAIAAQQREDPKIDWAAAEEAALGAVQGEVKETELEREGGSAVYEVEIAGKDGKLREVTVARATAGSSARRWKRKMAATTIRRVLTIRAPKTQSSSRPSWETRAHRGGTYATGSPPSAARSRPSC